MRPPRRTRGPRPETGPFPHRVDDLHDFRQGCVRKIVKTGNAREKWHVVVQLKQHHAHTQAARGARAAKDAGHDLDTHFIARGGSETDAYRNEARADDQVAHARQLDGLHDKFTAWSGLSARTNRRCVVLACAARSCMPSSSSQSKGQRKRCLPQPARCGRFPRRQKWTHSPRNGRARRPSLRFRQGDAWTSSPYDSGMFNTRGHVERAISSCAVGTPRSVRARWRTAGGAWSQ